MSMSGDDAYILSMDYTDERIEQVGGVTIDDENIKPNATWSSDKIARDYSTKEYVAEQISNTVHLVKEIVDEIPAVEDAKENVIYMVKDDTVTSGDVYKEYQLINGAVVQTGDTSIDLSGYAKLEDVENKTEIDDTVTSTETTWSSTKIKEEFDKIPSDTPNATYIINCTIVSETGLEIEVANYDGDFTKIKQTIADGGKVELRTNFNYSNYILEPSRVEDSYVTFNTVDKNTNFTIKVTKYGINDVSYIDLNSNGGATIDDAVTSTETTWSSEKIASELGGKVYTSLADLGLDTTATLTDITRTMGKGSIIAIKVDAMANQSEHNNIAQGTVTIHKIEDARIQAIMTEKSTGRTWVGILGGDNTITGWTEITKNEILHTDLSGNLAGITTVLDLINALLEEYRALSPKKLIRFVSGEITKTTLTDLPVTYGVLQITVAGWDVVEVRLAHSANGFKSMYYGFLTRITGQESISSIAWEQVITENKKGSKALVTNAQNFKIDLTKNNSSWYGMFTFNFMYGSTPCEITFTISDKVYYTITKGQNVVSAITYTQDGAKYTIGIDFTTKMYGTQVVEIPIEFGTINSLTAETFAGATSAILKGYNGKTYTKLAELGLTADATLDDAIAKVNGGQSATLSTMDFTNYKTLFPYAEEQDGYAIVRIEKSFDSSRTIVQWVRKDAAKVAYGGLNSSNKVQWWNEYATKSYVDSKVVTPVIKAAAGSNINTVGTPSVTASTSGNETTFTFNNLKGAKGDTGATPLIHVNGMGGGERTMAELGPNEGIIAICTNVGGGSFFTSVTDGTVKCNGSAFTSSKQPTAGTSYVIVNSGSSTARIYCKNNGGSAWTIMGDVL